MISFYKHPKRSLVNFVNRCCPALVSDSLFLHTQYRDRMGFYPDMRHPRRFTEKLMWMKLYDRNPLYTRMVDKYKAKEYVAEHIGPEHVIPAYGAWHHFDKIDFDALPNQFVLKCNHDSGSYVVCEDKTTFDREKARAILEPALKKTL